MATYVQKRTNMWRELKDIGPQRRRSESRLKTYSSSTDIRNWCDIVEDRRQHILELIIQDIQKSSGKFIPIEAIMQSLLAMDNAEIANLKNRVKELSDFIKSLDLKGDDLQRFQALGSKIETIQEDKECDEICVDEAKNMDQAGIGNVPHGLGASMRAMPNSGSPDGTVRPTITARVHGPATMVTRMRRLPSDYEVLTDPTKPGRITIKAAGPANIITRSPKISDGVSDNATGIFPDKLAATEALCNEQKAKIEELTKERDDLLKKLEACLKELDNFKKLQTVANPTLPASCQQEIEALEAEINIMRSGNPSPEEEAEIIKKEVEILKRYCTKLKEVESENEKLKVELGSRVALQESSDELEHSKIDTLKDKLKNLEELTMERDMLVNKVKQLEKQLKKCRGIPEDVELLKTRSDMLDGALQERDSMYKKCAQIKALEEELQKFKKKADRVDELERDLRNISKGDRSSGIELKKTQSIAGSLEKELQNLRYEKDAMQKRIDSLKKELETQKVKATEAEMLRLERDRLQIKLNELADIQSQYEEMLTKLKIFDNVKAERDMFKQKYEEVLDMECRCEMLKAQVDEARTMSRERDHLQKQVQDLESCICEQEEEIKGLVVQIDNISTTKDITKSQMQEELNKKDRLIAASQEQLSQSQNLIIRLKEMEKLLHNAEHKILKKDCHIACLENQLNCLTGSLGAGKKLNKKELDAVKCMGKQLETAKIENKRLQDILNKMVSISGDDHMKKILKQSECAVKRVVEELSQQYKDWEHIKTRSPKTNLTSNKDCLCHSPGGEGSSGDDCEKLRHELEALQREKLKLEQTVKNMQGLGISAEGSKCAGNRSCR